MAAPGPMEGWRSEDIFGEGKRCRFDERCTNPNCTFSHSDKWMMIDGFVTMRESEVQAGMFDSDEGRRYLGTKVVKTVRRMEKLDVGAGAVGYEKALMFVRKALVKYLGGKVDLDALVEAGRAELAKEENVPGRAKCATVQHCRSIEGEGEGKVYLSRGVILSVMKDEQEHAFNVFRTDGESFDIFYCSQPPFPLKTENDAAWFVDGMVRSWLMEYMHREDHDRDRTVISDMGCGLYCVSDVDCVFEKEGTVHYCELKSKVRKEREGNRVHKELLQMEVTRRCLQCHEGLIPGGADLVVGYFKPKGSKVSICAYKVDKQAFRSLKLKSVQAKCIEDLRNELRGLESDTLYRVKYTPKEGFKVQKDPVFTEECLQNFEMFKAALGGNLPYPYNPSTPAQEQAGQEPAVGDKRHAEHPAPSPKRQAQDPEIHDER